ncbi:MAG: hypothetical protein MJ252_13190 [archaeon]|nr:hypothetical protein [archaeon]
MRQVILALLISFAFSVRILDHISNAEQGVDVSAYQESVNWVKVKDSGRTFAILRTTVKDGTMDKYFESNYQNAKNAGLEVSGYHFSYSMSTSEATAAAKNLVSKLNGKKLPIYIDLEYSSQGQKGKRAVTDIAIAFIKQMKASGYEAHVYSNTNWYKNYYYPDELKALGCQFWIAAYGTNDGTMQEKYRPNVGESIWQYTSNGSCPGISGRCDLDVKGK